MSDTLVRFAETVREKFATHVSGEPEDQLRAPFEQLLRDASTAMGVSEVIPIGETSLSNGIGRPDYGVTRNKLVCGYVELKAPGKGANTSLFKGHDKRQWERFKNLPNIIYSDGCEFALYRMGERVHGFSLANNPCLMGGNAIDAKNTRLFAALLCDFLDWQPIVPKSAKQLAQYIAPLCRNLRDDVLDALRNGVEGVMAAANDWRRYLFPGTDDAHFADAYAQTVTFSLLLARSNGSDTLFIDEAVATLTHANSLLSRALKVLTDPFVKEHLGASLDMLMRVIGAAPTGSMSGGRHDPWLHFYEDFLAEYDPELRRSAGVYYTPVEVVKAQVCLVDELLRTKFGKKLGFADNVQVLDPAVGTGTYLLGVIEHALEQVLQTEGKGAMSARASLMGNNLYGFEFMVGPYAVAALRLTRMLQQYQGTLPGDGVQIMLNNTLESPYEAIPELPLLYRPIGLEHKRAKRVKETVPILVCLGNPPYGRHEAATSSNKAFTGGWVRHGDEDDQKDAILKDFIEPVQAAGKGGDLKNLYNLYVYFWRWALWKTFEHDLALGQGIVSFITASSFIDGDAFLGMRSYMRQLCDEIWIIDLGGEGRGTRQDENVFVIQTPVAITIAVRYQKPKPKTPAHVHYTRIEGTRAGKLLQLEQLKSLNDLVFDLCPNAWEAPFRPEGKGVYFSWPLLTDLMPWQQSGVKCGRTWVISSNKDVLEKRFQQLAQSDLAQRSSLFKDSPTGKKITDPTESCVPHCKDESRIIELTKYSKFPSAQQYSFRSFDRQFIINDGRFIDRSSPLLWQALSQKQVFLASLLTKKLGDGPALSITSFIPDMDFFSGRGAKDILPLYRDAQATQPNLHPQLIQALSHSYKYFVTPEDFVAYAYAVLAQPTFTRHFAEELESSELRLPLTKRKDLFKRAVDLGKELIFLHTYGERFCKNRTWSLQTVKCTSAMPSDRMPESFSYDDNRKILSVDTGRFAPVSKEVWEYEISGLKVVQSWLGYRLKNRKGKKSSELDNITPIAWTHETLTEFLKLLNLLTRTVEIHRDQAQLFEKILADGDCMPAEAFGQVPDALRTPPRIDNTQREIDFSD